MEWATGINLAAGAMELVDTSLGVQHLPTSKAFNRGTPTVTSERARITVSCSALHPSRDAERAYTQAFQLSSSDKEMGRHLVFEGSVDSVRYIVPALVLMRTFFTPARCMLGTMFGPHALDQTCYLDYETYPNNLIMLSTWATEANARRYGPWEPRFKWMLSHKSAFRMAGSVHEFASQGIIGLSLPLATISAVVDGVRRHNDFYVTKVTLITIEPEEPPCVNIESTAFVDLHNNANFLVNEGIGPQRVNKLQIPTHKDGQVDLTDGEWEKLKTIVLRNSTRLYKHCPRLLLDGVLAKMASGKGWRALQYKVGDWRNASYTYQAFRKSGVLDEVITFLRNARVSEPGAHNCVQSE